jgi:hypothetical protein
MRKSGKTHRLDVCRIYMGSVANEKPGNKPSARVERLQGEHDPVPQRITETKGH